MAVRLSYMSIFSPFLSLRQTAWQPYRLSHIAAFCINLSFSPKDQFLKFSRKNIENWQSWKMRFFFGFWLLGFPNNFFTNENQLGFHMRYQLILHYGSFIQNLGKDFIRTNMHTTVSIGSFTIRVKQSENHDWPITFVHLCMYK